MMRTKFVAALAAGLLAVPMAASAAIVTQLIHFDDAINGWKWYSDKDLNFLFNPTNLNSAAHCANPTSGGGNGSCVLEGQGNGELPLMTRPTTGPQSQGSASADPIASGYETFTLNSFYFHMEGQGGQGGANSITVTGGTGTTPGSNVVNTFTFALGTDWDAAALPDVRFYEGASAGSLAGSLVQDTGYIATFGNLFANVTWIQFSGAGTAQSRLDCVVATFDGSTTEGLKPGTTCGLGNGGPPPTDLPEPGTLGLLSLALLGLGFAGRRRVN